MLKSLSRTGVAVVAAVGLALSPIAGLAVAEPADETDVVTTTPLPPPADAPPPEAETPQEPPAEEAPPPVETPATDPPATPPSEEVPPAEEAPPSTEAPPEEQAPSPPAEEPVPEQSTEPPVEVPPSDPPASESTEEVPPPADETPVETTPPVEEETSSPETPVPPATDAPSTSGGEAEVTETTPVEGGEPSTDGSDPSQPPAEQVPETSVEQAEAAVAVVPEPPSVDPADVQQAFAKEPLVEQPLPVPVAETDMVYEQIKSSLPNHGPGGPSGRPDGKENRNHDRWDGKVRPWSPNWIRYDNPRHHGPVFCNPYHDRDIKIFYVYQGHQYVRVIRPQQSIFVNVDVRVHNVHSFTAVHVKAGNVIVDVNVGTFHHPAFVPPVHQNVNVKVVVNNHYYPRPFTVKKVVDCGYDQVRRKVRVVFDDTYVAWGNWRGKGKDRHFALEESATYPGMYGKAAEVVAAPPEPYIQASQPRNVAAETQLTSNEGLWIGGGALALALAVGALAWALLHRNRGGTPPQHS